MIPGRNVSGYTVVVGKTTSWWWEAPSEVNASRVSLMGFFALRAPLPKPRATKWIILEARFQRGSESHPTPISEASWDPLL